MPIKANEIGGMVYDMLVDAVVEEYGYKDEEAIAAILNALSVASFH